MKKKTTKMRGMRLREATYKAVVQAAKAANAHRTGRQAARRSRSRSIGHAGPFVRPIGGAVSKSPDPEQFVSFRRSELRTRRTARRAASLFLAAERGILHDPGQHASYVSPWIKALSDDRNEIFRAAYDASRASAFLLALERDKSLANLRLLRPKPRRQRWSRKPLESTRILKPSRI